jgi:glycosyltransferase involved in cell wall biosynthesis
MRILVVHPRMSVMGGGEQVAVHSMLASLKMGHEVALLAQEFDTSQLEKFYGFPGLFSRVSLQLFPVFKPMHGSGLLLYRRLYYYQRQFRRLLGRQDPFNLVLGTQDVGYTPSIKAPMVQYCHFPESFKHLQSDSASLRWRVYYGPARMFYRNRVRRVNQLLSNSDYTRGFVRRLWNRDSTVLYPPCRTELYHPAPEKENLVAIVGRIAPEKRIELFIEIARNLPGFKFAVIGSMASPAYLDSLKKAAPTNVSFQVSPLRQSEVLAKAKIYVHCMENEHFGIVIVEAMAAGCVPVVHDSGGPREIVTPSVGFRWNSVNEAEEQITTLMQNEGLRQKLSRAAMDRSKLFSAERFEAGLSGIVENYEKVRHAGSPRVPSRAHESDPEELSQTRVRQFKNA